MQHFHVENQLSIYTQYTTMALSCQESFAYFNFSPILPFQILPKQRRTTQEQEIVQDFRYDFPQKIMFQWKRAYLLHLVNHLTNGYCMFVKLLAVL